MITVVDSYDLGKYISATDGVSKPWLLVQLRIKKLQERRLEISAQEYIQELEDIHKDLMNLGEWWVGREEEVFGSQNHGF
ncbi:MAG: hypothetical protein N5P05_000816 [Chroococcopsis gigantea SAG 12.99]|nr:hypothetical protein [Chroococcopsis gigantea SAG 12.99]